MPAPSAPIINPQPRSSPGTIEFQWSPPVSDGGSPITGYLIRIDDNPNYNSFVYSITTDENGRYIKIPVLGDGINYYCTISATNDEGATYGPVAKFRAPWQCGSKPNAPDSITVVNNGGGTYTVTWGNSPVSEPVAIIFWYVITATSDNSGDLIVRISVDGSKRTTTIVGLNPASSYTFLVQAVNCPGYSPGIVS